ncbi:MAG: hypothetical protein KDA32_14665 [Phycisphaerales bacterium]|nr:hypothetical protein [Phycisphaerales bacterium]
MADVRFLGVRIPELDLVDDEAERKALVKHALRRLHARPTLWLRMIVFFVLIIGFAVVMSITLRRWLPDPAFVGGVLGGVGGGGVMWLVGWTLREEARRIIREQLRARGVPICIRCGYDLRGSPTPKCPECGFDNPPV